MRKAKIAVIGLTGLSAFMNTANFPKPGETVSCRSLLWEPGGKGHNQAVACARMGVQTVFIGAVGEDVYGMKCKAFLEQEGITVCLYEKKHPTAFAVITTDQTGENTVEVFGGAALKLDDKDLLSDRVQRELKDCNYLLLQNELSKECLETALELAQLYGIQVIFNPAPAEEFSPQFLKKIDLITPNYGEAKVMAGFKKEEKPDGRELWEAFRFLGISNAIVTMGSKGALVLNEKGYQLIPAFHCGTTIDTTGAGDTYNGTLAAFLALGRNVEEATYMAAVAAGISVTRGGAAGSIPGYTEVMKYAKEEVYCE